MAGDRETGVAVMRMEEGLDTGPVAMVERVPIGPDATAGELHDGLARLGADLMGRALAALSRGALRRLRTPYDGPALQGLALTAGGRAAAGPVRYPAAFAGLS